MKDTRLFINIEGERDLASSMVVMAVEEFGRNYLERYFNPALFVKELPRIGDYKRDGKIMIDSYRQALWDFYNINKDREIFTVDVVNSPLVPDRFYDEVFTSSVHYFDLETGKLISPDKAGVIVSRTSLDPNAKEGQKALMAYLLGTHEIGHLALGHEVCNSDNCIYSHNPGSLERIAGRYFEVNKENKIPVCDFDKRRLEEFKKRWQGK